MNSVLKKKDQLILFLNHGARKQEFKMNLLKTLLYHVFNLIPIKKGTVLIVEKSFPSGSSTKALYDKMKQQGIKVDVRNIHETYPAKSIFRKYLGKLKRTYSLCQYEVIICTHGFKKLNKYQILIELWHGTPLKAMGYMENEKTKRTYEADYLITSSKIESVLLASCMFIPFHKHRILGKPRNDYMLDKSSSIRPFSDWQKQYEKILLYMPTFRQKLGEQEEGKSKGNFLQTSENEAGLLTEYLEKNNYLLLVKIHPNEETLYQEVLNAPNIQLLTSDFFIQQDMDLYQMLSYTDLLVTDYSSIYFDYLLLDKPIVFNHYDLEEYKATRGLLLEPYEQWTPGIKAKTQKQVLEAITQSFEKDPFKDERESLCQIFHEEKDKNASHRIISFIKAISLV